MAAHDVTVIMISGGTIKFMKVDEASTAELWPGLAPPQVLEAMLPVLVEQVEDAAKDQVPGVRDRLDEYMNEHVTIG